MLAVEDLSVSFGGLAALSGVSLEVGEGELVSLIGANGAGKTTLLRAISGTVRASGSIGFAGERLDGASSFMRARAGVVHVPQGRRIFAGMTVEENLLVASSYRGKPERLQQVYDLFPALHAKRQQASGMLSGGQQQMVAIGRGIMSDPRLLMLDEPSTGLAPALVDQIFDAIIAMQKTYKMALLLVEQRAAAALDMTERSYVLEQGRIVLAGQSSALRSDDRVRRAYLGI